MRMDFLNLALLGAIVASIGTGHGQDNARPLEILGGSVVPHVRAESMRCRHARPNEDGALVRLFVRATQPTRLGELRINDQSATELLLSRSWYWHDYPDHWSDEERELAPDTLIVLTHNAAHFDEGSVFTIENRTEDSTVSIETLLHGPRVRLKALTFLSSVEAINPNRIVFHMLNESDGPIRLLS